MPEVDRLSRDAAASSHRQALQAAAQGRVLGRGRAQHLTTHPYFDHPGPLAIAHRGGAGVEPENTMRAFQRAVDSGYRWLETDVHVTLDGEVVAFHDEALDRVTDRVGLIREQTWAEVSRARIDGEPIPRLHDLFDAFPDTRFSIDPKHDTVVESLATIVTDRHKLDHLCFGAFSDARLARLRGRLGAGACIGLGPRGMARLRMRSLGVPVPVPRAECSQPSLKVGPVPLVDRRLVDASHARAMPVVVWTIDDRSDMRRLIELGVDGIITDVPDVLREELEAAGQWFD